MSTIKYLKRLIMTSLLTIIILLVTSCTINTVDNTIESSTETETESIEETYKEEETAEQSYKGSGYIGIDDYQPATRYEVEGDICYILDYTGGPIPKEFDKFKKFDFSKNNNVKIKTLKAMFGSYFNPENYYDDYLSSFTDIEYVNLTGLDTSECTDMSYMFSECLSLAKIDFGNIDTSKVTNMYKTFSDCHSLTEIENFNIDTSNVENMRGTFFKCLKLKKLNYESLNSKVVNDLSYSFYRVGLEDIDLTNLDTRNVTDFKYMFANCSNTKSINISNFNTEKVVDMSYMFYNCKKIKNIDLSSFNTKRVKRITHMFDGMESLEIIDLSNFSVEGISNDVNDLKDFDYLFNNCKKLKAIDISNFVAKEASISYMFSNCYDLEIINMLGIQDVVYCDFVFDCCGKLKQVILDEKNEYDKDSHFRKALEYIKDTKENSAYSRRKKDIYNRDLLTTSEAGWHKLVQNEFAVVPSDNYKEFFNIYEKNRYDEFPNFVTTDSILHTYHLYFDYLMKEIEKNNLYKNINDIMLSLEGISKNYYNELKGTEYEQYAKTLMAYFAVPLKIFNENYEVDEVINQIVEEEISLISEHKETYKVKPIFNEYLPEDFYDSSVYESKASLYMDDYTQYKPRGHYDNDEVLEKYFKALMWFGRVNFSNKEDNLTKVAILMSYALNESGLMKKYEDIKNTIYYFAGFSDDCGPKEYFDVIKESYNSETMNKDIIINNDNYKIFRNNVRKLASSRINSQPEVFVIKENENDTNVNFRFIGQTYTYDEEIFKRLIYDYVDKSAKNEKRYLPDFLDVPASLNSDIATEILMEEANDRFVKYTDNLNVLKNEMPKNIDDDNSEILYLKWLKVLKSLIDSDKNDENFPSFMKNREWKKKKLETFGGSYAELKHDTILYAKQTYGAAEMGEGGMDEFYDSDEIIYDSKGYVEPEIAVYDLLSSIAINMKNKFTEANMIDAKGIEFLDNFSELANKLSIISKKELNDEALTDLEYDFIKEYGGNIEHLIVGSGAYEYDYEFQKSNAIVADIATGESDRGYYAREIATGNPIKVYVLVKVDGKYKICSGGVFDFYQFEVPAEDRMTDIEWRTLMGFDDNLIVAGEKNIPVEELWQDSDNYDKIQNRLYKNDNETKPKFQSWTESYRYRGMENTPGIKNIVYVGGDNY